MRYVLGFDGGGTKTECVLMDEAQRILARSRSGPSNPFRVGFQAAAAALEAAASHALAEAHTEPPFIAAMYAGIAGTQHPEAAKKVHEALAKIFPEARVCVVTDLTLSLEATGQHPAAVLVAGTGSAVIGRDAQGHLARAGGYGPVLGDQGSAYDMGRQAILAALRAGDRTGADSALGAQILRQLKCPSWTEVLERARSSADETFPRLFPVIASVADAGDEDARKLLRDAALELASLVEIVVERLRLRDTIFLLAKTGGTVGRSPFFDTELDERLRQVAPLAKIGPLPIPPAEAAARLALCLISAAESAGN
jgi:N-acetylglucosamine kinase-like BadF-type ATPase